MRHVDWHDLAHFLALSRGGSLGVAGRALGVAPTTVRRRVESLEGSLGARLFDRTPEGMRPTPEGKRLVALAERVEGRVHELERAVASRGPKVEGLVRLSATEAVTAEVLAPALPRLFDRHPALRLDVLVRGEVVSLSRRECDVAVRMSRPSGDSLVARRVGTVGLALYASRAYLGGRAPRGAALARERFVGYDDSYGPIAEVAWLRRSGLEGALVFRTGSTGALVRAVRAGVGVGLLPCFLARRHAELVELSAPSPPPERDAWAVMHRDMRRSPALRAVVEFVVEAFDEALRGAGG